MIIATRVSNGATLVSFALLTCAWGCTEGTPTGPSARDVPADTRTTLTPVTASAEWPASTPEAERVDPVRLTDAVNRIRRGEYGRIHALLVVRNERLILEEYFNSWGAAGEHAQQSVTKSVTSLAAGLAIDRGHLRLTDGVTALFPDYEPIAARDANKDALTVRDLLMMRTGLDWSEQNYQGSPLERLNTCSCDWIRLVLDWRMREPPGARFEYVSGGVILLGAVIGRATGRRVDTFLDEQLFAPLGFENVRWVRGLPGGLPHTGGGLFLRARDMAKLGTLAATGGRWQGRQLISESWMRESTQPRGDIVRSLGGQPATYGYLWWELPGGVITASGARGQWIFAVPNRQLVVVSIAENAGSLEGAAARLLYDFVLPAVP
jgi:CubicO group peptidase (beta-lactamase class C family)